MRRQCRGRFDLPLLRTCSLLARKARGHVLHEQHLCLPPWPPRRSNLVCTREAVGLQGSPVSGSEDRQLACASVRECHPRPCTRLAILLTVVTPSYTRARDP